MALTEENILCRVALPTLGIFKAFSAQFPLESVPFHLSSDNICSEHFSASKVYEGILALTMFVVGTLVLAKSTWAP